jgi:hypothetical protein
MRLLREVLLRNVSAGTVFERRARERLGASLQKRDDIGR